ncbi:hypothetical protein Tco_0841852 [Tanacetum coccineum]|uniref:Uncharacterized protein n=1 Tax=Tanacetum coccineum TaxID=301880 RepID=A0ABQ5AY69_9ASTR
MDRLSDASLLKAAQVKEALKKSKKESYMLHPSGSGDRVGSKPKVPDESGDKTTGTDEGTGTKPRVPGVPKYLSESENKSWGDSGDDGSNDDGSNKVTKDDDEDDVESDANDDKEAKYDEFYKDVDVKSLDAEREKERKGDAEMTDVDKNASQERSYEQVVDDAHVTLTTTQKTEGSIQSSSISSDFASKFLNLDNVPPADNEVASMINFKVFQEESSTLAPPLLIVPITDISKTSTLAAMTVPPIIQPFSYIPQMTTPTPVPITEPTTSSIPALSDFASLFGFDQRVSALEQQLSQSYTAEFEKEAQAEKEKYIDIIEKLVKEIIKYEVKSQLPHILPKEISDFATLVIQSTINESLENVVLAESSSQPQSTYEAATSLTEFELKKILLDKLEKSKWYRAAEQHRDLYDALVNLISSTRISLTLMVKRSKSKESKSSSSKGSKSQSKSSGKSAQAEEPVFETADTEMPQDQGDDLGNTKDQPNVMEASKHDWVKKPERPLTPGKPPTTFNELMSTPIDFSAYVLHNPKIENLTQEHLVGPAFNLLKRTCKSQVEVKYHFEEYQGRQVVVANYFFNNDLQYLKGGSLSSKYTNFTTKPKAGKMSKHDVFSTKRIIAVTHIQVMKKYDYEYLEEIIVRREDQSLHKFVEGDFLRLNLRDIEDMLLLLVQKKALQSGKT